LNTFELDLQQKSGHLAKSHAATFLLNISISNASSIAASFYAWKD